MAQILYRCRKPRDLLLPYPNVWNKNHIGWPMKIRITIKLVRGVACADLDRNFIGIELEVIFIKLTTERIGRANEE